MTVVLGTCVYRFFVPWYDIALLKCTQSDVPIKDILLQLATSLRKFTTSNWIREGSQKSVQDFMVRDFIIVSKNHPEPSG